MNCRSCGAEILWALTKNGKRIPLNAEPVERMKGTFQLTYPGGEGSEPVAVTMAGTDVYVSHFATCPNASAWRRS